MHNILQKNQITNFNNPGPNPIIINPDGSTEKLEMDKFSSSYLCLVVFRGAFEELSSTEIMEFSTNNFNFQHLNCKVIGVVRDSLMAVQDWLAQPMAEKNGKTFSAISCISSPGIGKEDFGLIQALGVPLVEGSPIPTIIVLDRMKKIRYFASFSDTTKRNVEETLRVVAAIKMVDKEKGLAFAPADWEYNQPAIKNNKADILKYYQDKYMEDEKNNKFKLFCSVKKWLGMNYSDNC